MPLFFVLFLCYYHITVFLKRQQSYIEENMDLLEVEASLRPSILESI